MIINLRDCKIFARNIETGEVKEITKNLYWFEEEMIRGVDDDGYYRGPCGEAFEIWIEAEPHS